MLIKNKNKKKKKRKKKKPTRSKSSRSAPKLRKSGEITDQSIDLIGRDIPYPSGAAVLPRRLLDMGSQTDHPSRTVRPYYKAIC
jgi:hypothetical protein